MEKIEQQGEAMVVFDHVSVKRGDVLALDEVSFRLEKGEYVGLIGPNGAGKTTLLLTILANISPDSGTIFVSSDARIGYVPQKYLPNTTFPVSVEEIVSMGFHRMSIVRRKEDKEKTLRALDQVGLSASFAKRNFAHLSGGEKQRVIIARSLVHDPNFLLFDEPTSGVDHMTKIRIYELLAKLNKEQKMTILFVSHEIEHVVHSCKRVLCLDHHLHEGCRPEYLEDSKMKNSEIAKKIIPIRHTRQSQTQRSQHDIHEQL